MFPCHDIVMGSHQFVDRCVRIIMDWCSVILVSFLPNVHSSQMEWWYEYLTFNDLKYTMIMKRLSKVHTWYHDIIFCFRYCDKMNLVSSLRPEFSLQGKSIFIQGKLSRTCIKIAQGTMNVSRGLKLIDRRWMRFGSEWNFGRNRAAAVTPTS